MTPERDSEETLVRYKLLYKNGAGNTRGFHSVWDIMKLLANYFTKCRHPVFLKGK